MARRFPGGPSNLSAGIIGDLVPAQTKPFNAAMVRPLKLLAGLKVGKKVENPAGFTAPADYKPTAKDLELHAAINAVRKASGKPELPWDNALGWLARCKTQMLGSAILPRPAGYQKAPPSPHSWALKAGNPWGVANTYECSQDTKLDCSAYAAAKILGYNNFAYEVQYHNTASVSPDFVVQKWLSSPGHKAAVLSANDIHSGASFGPAYGLGASYDETNQQYVANLGLAPANSVVLPGASTQQQGQQTGQQSQQKGQPQGQQVDAPDEQTATEPAKTTPGPAGRAVTINKLTNKPKTTVPTETVLVEDPGLSAWWLVGGLAGAAGLGYLWWRFRDQ